MHPRHNTTTTTQLMASQHSVQIQHIKFDENWFGSLGLLLVGGWVGGWVDGYEETNNNQFSKGT
jgi:hypothetical protein